MMVGQGGFQTDITRAVNALSQLEWVDSVLGVPVGQAVEPPVDSPDLATRHGPLEQGVQARATASDPKRGLVSREDASFRLLKRDLGDRLHMQYTVIKRQLDASNLDSIWVFGLQVEGAF